MFHIIRLLTIIINLSARPSFICLFPFKPNNNSLIRVNVLDGIDGKHKSLIFSWLKPLFVEIKFIYFRFIIFCIEQLTYYNIYNIRSRTSRKILKYSQSLWVLRVYLRVIYHPADENEYSDCPFKVLTLYRIEITQWIFQNCLKRWVLKQFRRFIL